MKGSSANKKRDNANPNWYPNNQSNGVANFYENSDVTTAFNDHQDYLLVNSIGSSVIATVTSGVKYSGILAACNPESKEGIEVVLKFPKVIDAGFSDIDIEDLTNKLSDTLFITGEDVAELELNDLDFSLDEKWEISKKMELEAKQKKVEAQQNDKPGFKTDVDISRGNNNIKERELQKWAPDEGDAILENNRTLEDSSSTWDQFAVNEKKFGVKSSFDEHLYTTKINKNDPNFNRWLKEADRIAKEIESQGTSGNIHIAEDRGIMVDDSGLDEEDKYSGVDRRGDELLAVLKSKSKPTETKPGKYVPPTLRSQPHHIDPAIISSVGLKNMVSKPSGKAENVIATQSAPAIATPPAPVIIAPPSPVITAPTAPAIASTAMKSSIESTPKLSSKNDSKSSSKSAAKEAQIEELKKFAQKFKVPYEVPEEMKRVVGHSPNSAKTVSAATSEPSDKVSKSASPSKSQTQGRSLTSSRKRTAASFFGSKAPHSTDNKEELFNKNFNMFQSAKEKYDEKIEKAKTESSEFTSMEPFFIEKPYFTAPTWRSTINQSYKTLFPDEQTATQKARMRFQQRQMSSMNAAVMANSHMGMTMGNMMRYHMGAASGGPMMNGGMNMYMPFQPQPVFYPSMPQMMGAMSDSNGSGSAMCGSPHFTPGYGMPGTPMGAYGYSAGIPFQGMMSNKTNDNRIGSGHYRQNNHYNGNSSGSHHNKNGH